MSVQLTADYQNKFGFDKNTDPKHYDPQQFTYSSLKEKITGALNDGISFVSVSELKEAIETEDVNADKMAAINIPVAFSLQSAVKLVEEIRKIPVEIPLSIMLETDHRYYDVTSNDSHEALRSLAAANVEIGLRINPKDSKGQTLSVEKIKNIAQEGVATLNEINGVKVTTLGFDPVNINPNELQNITAAADVKGITNTYDTIFKQGYIVQSSNGVHAAKTPEDAFAGNKPVLWQVIECWYTKEPQLPLDRLRALGTDTFAKLEANYLPKVKRPVLGQEGTWTPVVTATPSPDMKRDL